MDQTRAQYPELEVRERSLAEHPELGPRYGVTSAPAVVINGRLEFHGVPDVRTLHARLGTIAREG